MNPNSLRLQRRHDKFKTFFELLADVGTSTIVPESASGEDFNQLGLGINRVALQGWLLRPFKGQDGPNFFSF